MRSLRLRFCQPDPDARATPTRAPMPAHGYDGPLARTENRADEWPVIGALPTYRRSKRLSLDRPERAFAACLITNPRFRMQVQGGA